LKHLFATYFVNTHHAATQANHPKNPFRHTPGHQLRQDVCQGVRHAGRSHKGSSMAKSGLRRDAVVGRTEPDYRGIYSGE
jgi:hypothetical protein